MRNAEPSVSGKGSDAFFWRRDQFITDLLLNVLGRVKRRSVMPRRENNITAAHPALETSPHDVTFLLRLVR
ncbi:hypothetical protein HYQ46_003459 [Verticillium longisporum]|nr:hypothetical protein HYQ46_003459 [Verticillium longisporum]